MVQPAAVFDDHAFIQIQTGLVDLDKQGVRGFIAGIYQ
jgi:hypothetical protein